MSPISPIFLSLAAGVVLTACAAGLDTAERAAPPPDPFAAALHAGYIALARAEHDENDFADADFFADRAIRAARGEPPPPSLLSMRTLTADAVPALSAARDRLVAALAVAAGQPAPGSAAQAARAQLAFECWMQEQEENRQPADIAACRSDFSAAMAEIERRGVAGRPSGVRILRPTPALLKTRAAGPAVPQTRFVVYFDFDEAGLSRESEELLSRVAGAVRRSGAIMVSIAGHADRAGPKPHNLALSRLRAQAVVAGLRRLGLPDVGIATLARGEDSPAVATPDGRPERRNRRVEIELTH